MNLGELLAELREAILNDRSDRTSGTSDWLWTDAMLVRYINEAQRRFASKSFCLVDGTTDEVTLLTLVEDQDVYPLHPSILAVRSVKLTIATIDLIRVGHPFLAAYRAPTDRWLDPAAFATATTGAPLAFSTDEELGEDDNGSRSTLQLRVYPVPDADAAGGQLRMRVVRRPLENFIGSDLGAYPEIPEDHHLEMLDWAAYLALRIVDDDAGNPKRAADFAASFNTHVMAARNVVLRKLDQPMPWGFGRRGFAWEH